MNLRVVKRFLVRVTLNAMYTSGVRLLPYERVTFRCEDRPEVVEARVATLLEEPATFSSIPPADEFQGSIHGKHFELTRVFDDFFGLPSTHPFRPVIVGEVAKVPGGAEVRIRIRLALGEAVFLTCWFGGFLLGLGMALWVGVTEGFRQTEAGGAVAICGGVVLVVYSLMSLSFWTQANKARAALRDRLGCREAETANRLVRR